LSKHEGFGLPLLEAAKFNKKIITSNRSSMYEISPKTSLFLDPYIKEDIAAETISSYLKNDIVIDNESYISNFSWELAMKEIFYNG
jgi:glycosyltransferase involved in cell wall biosynthesis